jgi:cell wall-associated NlpC family hydrolase
MNLLNAQHCSTDLSRFIGIPYIDKGTDPAVGLDCWQLAKYFYREVMGKAIPDYLTFYKSSRSIDEAEGCIMEAVKEWQVVAAPDFGDICVFRIGNKPWHTGICIGNGMMLHTDEGHGSVIEPFNGVRWRNRIYGFYKWTS